MKAYLSVCLVCMIYFQKVFVVATNSKTPELSSNVVTQYTSRTASLKKPFCYFDNVTNSSCPCTVWLVAATGSATGTYENDKNSSSFTSQAPYPDVFSSSGKKYFATKVGDQSQLQCPENDIPFLVGAEGYCRGTNCNGVLPEGSTMKFKYILIGSNDKIIEDTKWSNDIVLKTLKEPDSLGSGFAGRSGAMVVITTILCVAAALLLVLLFIALIFVCCSKGKTHTYHPRRQPPEPVEGSLRVPRYDVHNLKNTSPYDNPAYEQDLKKRYTTNATLPQKTTTVITTMQDNSHDTGLMQKM